MRNDPAKAHRTRRFRVLAVFVLALGLVAAPAGAAPSHFSGDYTHNGCTWDGYHHYHTTGASGFVTGDTYKKGGNCVEVHVVVRFNNTTHHVYHATWAFYHHDAWLSPPPVNSFQYTDHNARPAGSGWVGFRMH